MDTNIRFDPEGRVVTLLGSESVALDDLYLQIRRWEASEEGIAHPEVVSALRTVSPDGRVPARVMIFVNDWKLASDEDVVITGGEVAAEVGGETVSPYAAGSEVRISTEPEPSSVPAGGGKASVESSTQAFVSDGPFRPPYITGLRVTSLKCFDQFDLPVASESSLGGHWTCIAGLNGAGKSTLLQAIAIARLGSGFAPELGRSRLDGLTRTVALDHSIELMGPLAASWRWPNPRPRAEGDVLLLGYGASRNLTDQLDSRHSHLSPTTRRVMGLFDPFAQVPAAEQLFGQSGWSDTGLRLASELVSAALDGVVELVPDDEGIRFVSAGQDSAVDGLPDGYRSSLAWLADIAFAAAEHHASASQEPQLADIAAVVLLDEIDLHLHPALQRAIIPRLRSALPNVQWIVTTHSPLVLSSFDRSELVVLDRDEEGGVRQLDRQILSFSADEVYRYLMGTEPNAEAMERVLESPPPGIDPEVVLAQSHGPTSDEQINEEEAERVVAQRRDRMRRILNLSD